MPQLTYSVRVERPTEHRAQFTLEVAGTVGSSFEIVFPSWVPGSYLIQDPVQRVRDVRASVLAREKPLVVERIDKARWRVHTTGSDPVEVQYTVYGHQMITEALDVTDRHLFLNAALCLPYVDGRKDEPADLIVHVPGEWKVFTELEEVGHHPPRFRARGYDELVDSPVDCGQPVELRLTASGIPHRVLLCGEGGNFEPHRLEEDLRKIAETTIRLFGESPVRHYTFFYHLNDQSDGGLEHRNSFSAVVPRQCFKPESAYRWFLSLTAHEYFHLYNVKRIRPKVLGPFDYTRENYTRLLWAMEGTTDYFAYLILRRAQLVTPAKTLESLATRIQRYLQVPGRAVNDLETLSFQSWVDLYKIHEDTVNHSVSYYLKGELVSFALDLEIRHRTENRVSLDDVWRTLWKEYGAQDRGLEEGEILSVAEKVSGLSLGPFFDRYIRGTDELDFGKVSRYAGLEFGPKPKPREVGDDDPAGYLGIEFENRNGLVRLTRVLDGGPARRAGLSPGDELVAINRNRVLFADFPKVLEKFPAGSNLELSVFRRGWLETISASTGVAPPESYRFTPVAQPTPLEKAIYESWLEATWEPPKPSPPAA